MEDDIDIGYEDLARSQLESTRPSEKVESTTPRTDAAVITTDRYISPGEGEFVSAEIARELERELTAMQRELESLRAFKRSVDEALNSGDGSYRP